MTYNVQNTVSLSVEPSFALIDDRLAIKITGLNPYQDITVHIRTVNDDGCTHASYGCFVANKDGEIDISKDKCIRGTYTGKF